MDGKVTPDQRGSRAGGLGWVLSVFQNSSGTRHPACLRVAIGDHRIHPERDSHNDLFPYAG